MAWTDTLTTRLRYVINDIASPQTFTDAQLQTYIAIAAVWVASETNLGTTFTIDTDTPSISPDPTASTVNIGIGNLFVLKAACIITQGELRRDTSKFGIRIRDHLTEYDAREGMSARIDTARSFCQLYEDTKWDYETGNRAAGRAIVGPVTHADTQDYSSKFALDWDGTSTRTREYEQ